MRWALLALIVLLSCLALARVTSAAAATRARAALDQANLALAAEPPERDGARAALSRAVEAKDDAVAVGEAYFLLGRLDEDAGAFPQAMAHDRAAVDAAPNTRLAVRALERIEWLRARSEGDFAPLARLERVRRDPEASSDPLAVAALARDLESFPPGVVQVEARMLVAEAWLGRMHRPADAIDPLRRVVVDPAADPLTQRLAERELVDAWVAMGQIDEAATEARAHSTRLDPGFVKQVQRLIVRRAVRVAAFVVLAAFAALAVLGLVGAWRRGVLDEAAREVRKLAPVAVFFVAFMAVGGGVLASKYESGSATPFLLLGAGVLPLLLLARAWSAVGSQATAARAARGLLCGVTVVAAAFVLLDRFGSQYLPGFGL
jgi:tetratricopeptide (TPR) repeat protein